MDADGREPNYSVLVVRLQRSEERHGEVADQGDEGESLDGEEVEECWLGHRKWPR